FAQVEGAPAMGPATGDLMIGAAEGDDAAVLRLDDERALVLTTDFFTPIVDDPGDWGRIAAANALSDVYAMGGRPLFAVNLAAWPGEGLDLALLAQVMRGGAEIAAQAGCFVAGGHTIDDPVPKYGLAVTGLADPAALMTIDRAARATVAGVPSIFRLSTGLRRPWHPVRGSARVAPSPCVRRAMRTA